MKLLLKGTQYIQTLAVMFFGMMKKSNKYLVLLAGLILTCCAGKNENKNGEKYSTVVYYDDNFQYNDPDRYKRRTERLLSRDTLYIFFETNFKSDTVEIKIDSEIAQTLYLNTNPVIGLADVAQFGDINSIDKIEISKNSGLPVTIELNDKSMNLWAVNFYSDTLRAERRKYLSTYE